MVSSNFCGELLFSTDDAMAQSAEHQSKEGFVPHLGQVIHT